jgi:hypothetical protein
MSLIRLCKRLTYREFPYFHSFYCSTIYMGHIPYTRQRIFEVREISSTRRGFYFLDDFLPRLH